MTEHSILLALSGSEQSRYAAELSWQLAESTDASVTAVHVVDTRTVWELLRNDQPGFLGSGPYLDAYEKVASSMQSLANKLTLEYEAQANGRNVKGEALIRDGNPVEILSRESRDFDLLVVGHQPSGTSSTGNVRSHYTRYSIAEGLAHESSAPLLIVQGKHKPWTTMTIISEMDHVNARLMRSCFKLAALLKIKPQIEFWGTGTREESPEQFLKNFDESVPEAKGLEVEFEFLHGKALTDRQSLFRAEPTRVSDKIADDALIVLPTRGIGRDRLTIFGLSPETFVRSLTLPNILLWPEERPEFGMRKTTATAACERTAK